MADPIDEAAGRLYGLPLEEFTRERDAAARELRKAKERDAAAQVAKLPKPSQAAWAANALARERRDLVDALLGAGDELRAAQEGAVAGRGAGALREAAAAERAAVDALVDAAKDLRPGGRTPTAQTLDRLRATLHAAAGDEDVRTALDQGRLVADATGGGAWGLVAGGDAAAAPAPRPKRKPARDDRERRDHEAALREARERRQQLEAELREARAERRSRERELERAERAAERAAKRLEAALAAADEAREQADEAKADLETARAAAQDARDNAARLEEQLD